MKVFAKGRKANRNMSNMLRISAGTERLIFFVAAIMLFVHFMTCMWIITASHGKENGWLK